LQDCYFFLSCLSIPPNARKGSSVTLTVTPETNRELQSLCVEDADGNEVLLTKTGDGKYKFTMPASKVTVKPVFAEEKAAVPFSENFNDVKETDWFAETARYTATHQILRGTNVDTFFPNVELTNAQVNAQVYQTLYNLYTASHKDETYKGTVAIPGSLHWTDDAMNWAAAKKLFDGTSYTADPVITRAQAA